MQKKTTINLIPQILISIILVLFVFFFILVNLATKRTEEVPGTSNDSKSNETFISEYKLLDSTIYIKNETYKIEEVWCAYGVASVKNIFMRKEVILFPPQFIIKIENGYPFSFKHKGYKFTFPEFHYNLSNEIRTETDDSYQYYYEVEKDDYKKLKTLDTVNFFLLDPEDSIINQFTLIKVNS
ncbi:MAG: hypothetical protein CVV25_00845 [Ignavibacteriae bacterium HGW-Ignavibacteriae-4]|jgi:hypothetical protein|nr:MAG: hypothetical protein CVV25_00845 [Ignavibacteriae bacterium HGW-Ignavibacteriae-4]